MQSSSDTRVGRRAVLAGAAAALLAGSGRRAFAAQDEPEQKPAAKKPVEMGDAVGKEFRPAGTVRIDDKLTGELSFTEHKKAYRVDITIPCRLTDKSLKGERFTVWLLGVDGQAMRVLERPPKGPLLMTSTGRSTCAQTIFVFAHDVPAKSLSGIAVQVDGQLTIHAIPKP